MSKETHTPPIPLKPDTEQFTDKQWQSVFDNSDNLLISASAGSGKTTVLVRRVIEKLKAGTDIDNLFDRHLYGSGGSGDERTDSSAIQEALAKESDIKKCHCTVIRRFARLDLFTSLMLFVWRWCGIEHQIMIDPVFSHAIYWTEILLKV